jgi:hypothetical protein
MTEYTLTRTGLRPITFTGELIAEADSEITGGKDHNRWHELALYRTAAGTYLAHVGYRTHWQGELDHDEVEELPDADALEGFLDSVDPCEHMAEMPGGEQFDRKRQFRQDLLNRNFRHAISELLVAMPKHIE